MVTEEGSQPSAETTPAVMRTWVLITAGVVCISTMGLCAAFGAFFVRPLQALGFR